MAQLSLQEAIDTSIAMEEKREMQEISQGHAKKHSAKVLTKPKPVHAEERPVEAEVPKSNETHKEEDPRAEDTSDQTPLAAEYDDLKSAYADLKQQYKICNRENREQSLELRNIKRQNVTLKETYIKIQDELHSDPSHGKLSKHEKSKYLEHFDYLEQKADHYKNEFQKRETHLTYLTKQTRDANSDREAIEDDNRKLQRKIRELSTNLTECRDDLLRLQPTSQQTPDTEIVDRYSNLCQQVAGWVDDQTEDPDVLEQYFDQLKGINDLPQELRGDVSIRQFKFAKQSSECLPLLLQYLIHCRIQAEVLGPQIFVFGLDEGHVALLQGIEEGMTELEPKRDALTIRRWRSETLRGLMKMDAFAAEQSRLAESLSQTLASIFSSLLLPPSTPPKQLNWQDLHKQIILPAITLSNTLRVSTNTYQHFSHLFARPTHAPNAVHRNEVGHYQMMDNATHKVIRADSNVRVAEDGRIGEEMFVVAPGMVRGGEAGKVVLTKPIVLVKLDEPMGKRAGRGIKALGAWTPSWFSGGAGEEEEGRG